tara:strand:+ start:6055 stop:6888 length:834 start_codon:yes stop_codon:yes gene_type:complete
MGLTSNVNNDLNKSIEDKKKTDFGKQQDEFNLDLERQQERKRKEKKSRMVLGIWGEPKTGKTGIALDFPDRQIYVLDWDSGVESTWIECYDATDRIVVYDPIVVDKDNKIDIKKSELNSHNFVRHVRGKIEEGEKPIFVLDGVDTWFDKCIYKVNPNPTEVTKMMPYQYGSRNKTFYFLLEAIFNLRCDIIYITHETEKYVDNVPVGVQPAWRDWGGKLEQEIYCEKKRIKGDIVFNAQLIGSRTNGNLVGKTWTIREGQPPNIVWNGIPELQEGKI